MNHPTPRINMDSVQITVDWSKHEIVLYSLFVRSRPTKFTGLTALYRPFCLVSLSLPGLYEPRWREIPNKISPGKKALQISSSLQHENINLANICKTLKNRFSDTHSYRAVKLSTKFKNTEENIYKIYLSFPRY